MMRSKDVYGFQQALGGWRFPSGNCVFGDNKGNTGYKTVLALPIRSAQALLDGRSAHEGWSSDNDWQGILPHELLPQVINPKQGWIVSANHRPIASFYPIPMGISTGSLGDTDRSWRLKERTQICIPLGEKQCPAVIKQLASSEIIHAVHPTGIERATRGSSDGRRSSVGPLITYSYL